MHDKHYKAPQEKLRAPERIRLLEIEHVVKLSLSGSNIKTVLDVGCGTGLFSEAFVKENLKVTGIDIDPGMIETANSHVPKAAFQEGTAEYIPFPDDSFDLVFLAHVLHESDDPLLVLSESNRVSRNAVCILEWPYQQEAQGPPLEHRLPIETIQEWISEVGFHDWNYSRLIHMDFYKLLI